MSGIETPGKSARTLGREPETVNKTTGGDRLGDFALDPQLAADTIAVAALPLSAVRLMRDANYPWLILVPRRADVAEIVDLEESDRVQLMAEISLASGALREEATACDKLNVAALGNMVRQLHVHVIARRIGDAAWPRPVWGVVPARKYAPGEAESLAQRIAARLR
jgi:diadenosine tetraphosphate (Ap4A) HIT family hydrolase